MKQIKLIHKGACRYVPVNDAAKLNSLVRDGWEPAKGANGKMIIRELVTHRNSQNLLNKTSDILTAINAEIAELNDLAESNEVVDLDDDE